MKYRDLFGRPFTIIILFTFSLFFIHNVKANEAICSAYSGAALGLCQAAFALGCDGSTTEPTGCTKVEEKFVDSTGEPPVWTLPSCPCGSSTEFVSYIEPNFPTSELTLLTSSNPVMIVWNSTSNLIISATNPSFFPSIFQCTFEGTGVAIEISQQEAERCILEMKSTAEQLNIPQSTCPPDCGGAGGGGGF